MLSLIKHQNPETAVNKLLKDLSIHIVPETIAGELEKHPDCPSLLAISDVLNNFNIENAAFRVDNDNLVNVPCPFIAHTHVNNGDFLVVNKIDGDTVLVSNEKWNRHKITLDEFKKMFKGVVLTAEPSAAHEAPATFPTFLATIKAPALITGVLLILLAALYGNGYFANLGWQTALLSVFKTAGLITSTLLLIQSIDSNNPLIQKLCETTTKVNCNAILSSKAAKVFEGLTWSEVGFFYFGGTWLLLLFGGGSVTVLWTLAILNAVSLPYTVYSIYYQARIAKQWCVLCCVVQALLWLEFLTQVSTFTHPFVFTGSGDVITIFICLLTPVILWTLLKPLFLKQQQLQPLKQQLRRFKYNTELFTNTLTAQPKYAIPGEEWSIVLGNVEADNIITMVSNPYCGPCAKAHKQLTELLEQGSGAVQARIVFTADNTDADIKTPVARHLMALNELPDKTIVENALHDWYEQKQKDYQAWAKVYPVQLNEANFYKLEKQNAWCKMAEVTATPTTLLNGYRLPDLYQLPDLKYMLE
ncbi:thioredoxin domain-containing protein [Mucilaginibacter sp. BJC16-A38]|uniref:cysteine peptidase family C39 domain-containing protein n=1 Tax=Mucilaginibacter phenanthrenivorans TaxID=1234842 RepID=UPI002157093D|nr:cysteine peptidase family C39 domain-containing protein [Mucilaginibacter phenanthrenivorans]MCR8561018.1 thioredoxin domain-containing protein [Mucilaginibacter phenanthrenivorans]